LTAAAFILKRALADKRHCQSELVLFMFFEDRCCACGYPY